MHSPFQREHFLVQARKLASRELKMGAFKEESTVKRILPSSNTSHKTGWKAQKHTRAQITTMDTRVWSYLLGRSVYIKLFVWLLIPSLLKCNKMWSGNSHVSYRLPSPSKDGITKCQSWKDFFFSQGLRHNTYSLSNYDWWALAGKYHSEELEQSEYQVSYFERFANNSFFYFALTVEAHFSDFSACAQGHWILEQGQKNDSYFTWFDPLHQK